MLIFKPNNACIKQLNLFELFLFFLEQLFELEFPELLTILVVCDMALRSVGFHFAGNFQAFGRGLSPVSLDVYDFAR